LLLAFFQKNLNAVELEGTVHWKIKIVFIYSTSRRFENRTTFFRLWNVDGEIIKNGLVPLFHAITINGYWSFQAHVFMFEKVTEKKCNTFKSHMDHFYDILFGSPLFSSVLTTYIAYTYHSNTSKLCIINPQPNPNPNPIVSTCSCLLLLRT